MFIKFNLSQHYQM